MIYCNNISLELLKKLSNSDLFDLSNFYDDTTFSNFIDDNVYAKYIYFIKDNDKKIGFIYLLHYRGNNNIYNVEYGIYEKFLNYDYIYTILTILRDKIKGEKNYSKEILGKAIVSGINKEEKKYNEVANTFGELIHSDNYCNYYEINPNCEDLHEEREKILKFLKKEK